MTKYSRLENAIYSEKASISMDSMIGAICEALHSLIKSENQSIDEVA